ncbi:MAG: T9SS type A sorting domain-containing protein, partial [Bacteroidales bacterium]
IRFNLDTDAQIALKLFNIMGEEVATMYNTYFNAGEYVLDGDLSNLPSGVYFLSLQSGEILQTTKILKQ